MAGVETGDATDSASESAPRAYTPSWVDRFTAWITRLPGPPWVAYLSLGLILFLVQGSVLWIEGAYAFPTVNRAHAYLAAVIPFMLALIHYLDERATAALAIIHPALNVSAKERLELHFQLTALPAGPTLLAGLIGVVCAFLIELPAGPYRLAELDDFRVSNDLLRFVYLLCWWVFGTFVYHTLHQLSLISRIYTKHTDVNLFRARSLYSLSNLTALTSGSLVVIPIGWMLANPWIPWNDPVTVAVVLVIQLIAVAVFIWPQLGIHRLQVAEKARLLGEINRRIEATISALHQRIDDGEFGKLTDLNTAMAALEMEKNTIKKIPTWPWEPDVVRLLITALAMPLGLWAIQFLLQRLMGS